MKDFRTVMVEYKGKKYILTFDEYDTLDTVEHAGKYLSSTNSAVKKFVANQYELFAYSMVDGVKYL